MDEFPDPLPVPAPEALEGAAEDEEDEEDEKDGKDDPNKEYSSKADAAAFLAASFPSKRYIFLIFSRKFPLYPLAVAGPLFMYRGNLLKPAWRTITFPTFL